MRRIAIMVVLLACSKGKPAAPEGGEHCLEAASRVGGSHFEMSRPRAEMDELGARMGKLEEALTAKCFNEKWPAAVTDCLMNISNSYEAKGCWSSLPDSAELDELVEQYEHRGAQ